MAYIAIAVDVVGLGIVACVFACPAIAAYLGITGPATLGTGTASVACAEECAPLADQLITKVGSQELVNTADFFSNLEVSTVSGPGGALPNAIGDLGVQAAIRNLGEDFIGTEAPIRSEIFGPGRIDIVSTGRFIEVKNVQNLYLTSQNELQLLKYVDAVGARNLQYDIYANYIQPNFLYALRSLGVYYRLLPYIPYMG